MSITDQRGGTDEVLRDARYHRAALAGNPRTTLIADRLRKPATQLKAARTVADEKDEARVEALARLLRVDFELDEKLRFVELEVLREVRKNRNDPRYKAVFPRGLSLVLALRGEEGAREIDALTKQLKLKKITNAATMAAELTQLAEASVSAEQEWRAAEQEAMHAFGQEAVARHELIRQLQKNEGALLAEFPGQRRRVRSFFRPTRRRGAAPDDGRPESTPEPVAEPAAAAS
jgi:hypothetical protein